MSHQDDQNLIEDEGTGYLISVSDVMSGLLFIFIITLVVFVINFQEAVQKEEKSRADLEKVIEINKKTKEVYAETVKQLVNSNEYRKEMLSQLEKSLAARGVNVEIDEKHGVLRLTEQAIQFGSGEIELVESQFEKLKIIGDVMATILPCYSANPPEVRVDGHVCRKELSGQIDSVFIEGHTDNNPVAPYGVSGYRFKDNWELSALRAVYTYYKLIPERPLLLQMKNTNDQPIFNVSGYGEGRPLPGHLHAEPAADAENRRIDIRFIMTPPSETIAEKALQEAGML